MIAGGRIFRTTALRLKAGACCIVAEGTRDCGYEYAELPVVRGCGDQNTVSRDKSTERSCSHRKAAIAFLTCPRGIEEEAKKPEPRKVLGRIMKSR